MCGGMGYVTRRAHRPRTLAGRPAPFLGQRLARLRSQAIWTWWPTNVRQLCRRPAQSRRAGLSILHSAYGRDLRPGSAGWLFLGTYGSGKTHLAIAIANYRLELGEPVPFMTVPDLLDHLRAPSLDAPVSTMRLFERIGRRRCSSWTIWAPRLNPWQRPTSSEPRICRLTARPTARADRSAHSAAS